MLCIRPDENEWAPLHARQLVKQFESEVRKRHMSRLAILGRFDSQSTSVHINVIPLQLQPLRFPKTRFTE